MRARKWFSVILTRFLGRPSLPDVPITPLFSTHGLLQNSTIVRIRGKMTMRASLAVSARHFTRPGATLAPAGPVKGRLAQQPKQPKQPGVYVCTYLPNGPIINRII
jgi:hypothetical protein